MVWAKGYTELLDLMARHMRARGDAGRVAMDCYGTGEDLEAVRGCAWGLGLQCPVLC